jgi:hypothetical protein
MPGSKNLPPLPCSGVLTSESGGAGDYKNEEEKPMARTYECKNCKYGPCVIDGPSDMSPVNTCLFLYEEAKWQKVYLQPSDPGGQEIVEAHKDYVACCDTYGVTTREKYQMDRRRFEIIQSEINEQRQAIDQLTDMLGCCQDSGLKAEIKAVQNALRGYVKDDPERMNRITAWRDKVEHRIEELEGKMSQVLPDYTPAKPDHAQAPDERGDMHDLIPGKSVVEDVCNPKANSGRSWRGIFSHTRPGSMASVFWFSLTNNEIFSSDMPLYTLRWLRDLKFPEQGGAT